MAEPVIDILIPTLGRADVLPALARNIRETTPEPHRAIFILDPDDEASWEAVGPLLGKDWMAVEHGGSFPVKTNAGYRAGSAPIVLSTGDDVRFYPEWLEIALETFANPEVQVMGGSDLSPITAQGKHATMPMFRRSYAENPGTAWRDPGKVFHEGYHHNWSETELWQLAEHRGVSRFVPECVIEHCHPSWGKREMDATYRKGAFTNEGHDHQLFDRRKAEWTNAE